MNVQRITYDPTYILMPLAEAKPPANGNPGIVPPWLTGKGVDMNVIGIGPVDPDVPTIM